MTVLEARRHAAEPLAKSNGSPVVDSWVISSVLVLCATTALVSVDGRLRHWFIIPVTISGVLIGIDAVDWARRRTDIFDPQALLGLFGFHFFYICPILHVMWDYWARYVVGAPDWREALGQMAILNAGGLLIYRAVVLHRSKITQWRRDRLTLNQPVVHLVGLAAIAVSLVAFAAVIVKFGGVSGYLFTFGHDRFNLLEKARGLGWLVVLGEAFPMIIFGLALIRWRERLSARPRLAYMLLVALILLQFIAGGARGARSNTIWPALLGLIMIHLVAVRISRRVLLICAVIFGLFMYIGGLYKDAGAEVLDIARGDRSAQELESETGRDLPTVVLGDLGRADIQALVLYRQQQGHSRIGYGITYIGGLSFLVPTQILPVDKRPETKVSIGTDMLYEPGAWAAGYRSSRIHGLAGEGILNFGYVGGLASFLVLGLAVRWARRRYRQAHLNADLVPKLLAPSLCVGIILFHGSDVDNLAWYAVKQVFPLALVILFSLHRRPQMEPESALPGLVQPTRLTARGR
jgi:hypothetical protein